MLRPNRILEPIRGSSTAVTMLALAIGLGVGLVAGLAVPPRESEQAEILQALRDELATADDALDAVGVSAHLHRAVGRATRVIVDVVNLQPLCRLPGVNRACRMLDAPPRKLREDADAMEHLVCVLRVVREHSTLEEVNAALADCEG